MTSGDKSPAPQQTTLMTWTKSPCAARPMSSVWQWSGASSRSSKTASRAVRSRNTPPTTCGLPTMPTARGNGKGLSSVAGGVPTGASSTARRASSACNGCPTSSTGGGHAAPSAMPRPTTADAAAGAPSMTRWSHTSHCCQRS